MWSCPWGGGGEGGLARGKTSRLALSLWVRRALSIEQHQVQRPTACVAAAAAARCGKSDGGGGGDGAVARGREEPHETSVLLHHTRAVNCSCNEGLGDKQSLNVDEP